METKMFIFSFISAAKDRFWRTGNWLMEIQNVYVLCARAGAPLPSHLCLAQGHSVSSKDSGMERNTLCFSQDPSAQILANGARNKS